MHAFKFCLFLLTTSFVYSTTPRPEHPTEKFTQCPQNDQLEQAVAILVD